jgi:citrate lyase subunit beta/citryl-CoA lyase
MMAVFETRLRSVLYLPASNPRAVAKAKSLPVSLLILDLEDAVPAEAKDSARTAAAAAVEDPTFPRAAIRVNGADTEWHRADLEAVGDSEAYCAVLPKVETPEAAASLCRRTGKPLLAMIETPRGVLAAAEIAAVEGVAGLIAGTNDLAVSLGMPAGCSRAGLVVSLQTIVLAARAAGIAPLDGVFNRLDDPAGLEAECIEGRGFGFDGKTLIHPNQVDIANRTFGPTDAEIEDAVALVEAASGGAERFRGRMIESMHVRAAEALLAEVQGFSGRR